MTDPTSSANQPSELHLDQTVKIKLYESMARIRAIELAIAERYSEQEMRCPVHLSVGQEAAAVGMCASLRADDQIITSHRCHGHYLAKGGNLNAMLGEIYGRITGCCGGRGGSMHLFDDRAGVLASVPIVASSVAVGVGAALAFQQRGEDRVSVAFLGDGALEEGVFHESANFAAVHKLPVIFFVENNLYSVYTNLKDRQPQRPFSDIAKAYAMPALHGDGNDVEAVYGLAQEAIERARSGGGPTFISVDTYRWLEHCGPAYDNHIGYRTEDEFKTWRKRCPVEAYEIKLLTQGVLQAEHLDNIAASISIEIEDAFTLAKAAPFPDPATVEDHVYA